LEINPKILIGSDDFNDLFFKKIDDIHDELIQGENLDFIIKKYNLEKGNIFSINESGEDKNSKIISHVPKNLIKDIFSLSDADPTTLIEKKDKFFIIEILKTENIQSGLESANVRENIVRNLETGIKRKLISEIISKLNQNNFIKSDFIKLSEDKDVVIKKIALDSKNDISTLKKELVNQIYAIPEKKINLVNDIGLTENYLIYIDMIENASIDEKSDEYEKYLNLSKTKITNGLFNTYDNFIKEKYKIDINYKALNTVKNYFN
jgi:RNA-binding protein YhbY